MNTAKRFLASHSSRLIQITTEGTVLPLSQPVDFFCSFNAWGV